MNKVGDPLKWVASLISQQKHEGKSLSDINWGDAAIAGAVGALPGAAGAYVQAANYIGRVGGFGLLGVAEANLTYIVTQYYHGKPICPWLLTH